MNEQREQKVGPQAQALDNGSWRVDALRDSESQNKYIQRYMLLYGMTHKEASALVGRPKGICNRCGGHAKSTRSIYCNHCSAEIRKETNKEQQKKLRSANPEQRARYEAIRRYIRKYGMTLEEAAARYDSRSNVKLGRPRKHEVQQLKALPIRKTRINDKLIPQLKSLIKRYKSFWATLNYIMEQEAAAGGNEKQEAGQ